jgi:sarcosine oxidase subunit beta
MGTSAAFHLAEAGVDVVLLERDQLGSGSTSKAAGGVRAAFSDPLNVALGARSLALFDDFPVRPGQQIDLHRSGYLFLLTRSEDVPVFEAAVELQRSMGVRASIVGVQEAQRLSPLMAADGVLAAAWSPDAGHCTPESVVLGYATGARLLGARVVTGTTVVGIDVVGDRITGVRTTSGTIAADVVIDCAGAWSPEVAAHVGLQLPVTPYRREIVVTPPLPDDLARELPEEMAFTLDVATTTYWHREGRGLLMGFSDPSTPPGADLGRDPEFPERLAEHLAVRAPRLLELGILTGWSGLYEVTPDHNALLGEWAGVSRFLYATGFSGHGFLQGPAVGEVLRDLVLEAEPFVDVSPLDVTRFSTGLLRPETHII